VANEALKAKLDDRQRLAEEALQGQPGRGGAAKKEWRKITPYKQMEQLHIEQEWQQCLPMTERTLKKVPSEQKRVRAECYEFRASCFVALKEFPQALKVATAATEEDKTIEKAWLTRGAAHGDLEQYAEAVVSID